MLQKIFSRIIYSNIYGETVHGGRDPIYHTLDFDSGRLSIVNVKFFSTLHQLEVNRFYVPTQTIILNL